jgi:putative transposase
MKKRDHFRSFKTSPEIIRLAVMVYIRFPLALRNIADLRHERGIEISHKSVRFWWNRFGPIFADEIRRRRIARMRSFHHWQWHLDEMFVKINGETHYLWRAFVREIDPALGEQVRDVAIAQRELEIQPDGVLDDLGRKAMAAIADVAHPPNLPSFTPVPVNVSTPPGGQQDAL